jgi:TonB family protein
MFPALKRRGRTEPRWSGYGLIVVIGVLAGTGCATMQTTGRIEEAYADSLFGTWRWVSADMDAQGQHAREGQLSLNSDSTYLLTEVSEGQPMTRRGRFKAYQVLDQDSLDPWIEFDPGSNRRQRVFQFSGRDTLLLRDGDSGYSVAGSEIDLYVRATQTLPAPPSRLPDEGQAYDQRPQPTNAPQPVYPQFARDAGIKGRVVLHVLVDESGRVKRVVVVQSVTGLDEAAIDAAKTMTFTPALKNRVPVAAWYELPMDFY